MTYSDPLRRNQRSSFLGIVVFATVIGAGFAIGRSLTADHGLKRGQYRITVVSRDSMNKTEGGVLRLTISDKEKGPIPVVVMYDGSSVGASIEPERRDTKTSGTVRVVPRSADQKDFSDVTMAMVKVTKQTSWFGMANQEQRMTATGQMTLSEKPFHWAAQDRVYEQGTHITLGTVEGKPVRLRVGYSATKP